MLYRLSIYLILFSMINTVIPANGIDITASRGDASEATSFSGSYNLNDVSSLNVKTILGDGYLLQDRNVAGPGKNQLKESVAGAQYSIENAIDSSGQLDSSSSAVASSDAGIVDASTSIIGGSGSIESIASSNVNTMLVSGGYSTEGDLKANLRSVASDAAFTTGSISMLGTECLGEDVVQYVASDNAAVTVGGLFENNNGIGEFGVLAANYKGSGLNAGKAGSSAQTGESKGYLLAGWRWDIDPNIQMRLVGTTVPLGIGSGSATTAIAAAAQTWDSETHEALFAQTPVIPATANPTYSTRPVQDGSNTQAWTTGFGANSNIIAETVTWSTRAKIATADNGKLYGKAVESDCWYNSNLNWRIAAGPDDGITTEGYDLRTIALHELGHTIGLSDLYNGANLEKTMYGINNGHSDWSLSDTDKLGLWQLYGHDSKGVLT